MLYLCVAGDPHLIDAIIEAVPVNMSQAAEVTGLRVFMFAAQGSEERIFVCTQTLIVLSQLFLRSRNNDFIGGWGAGANQPFNQE